MWWRKSSRSVLSSWQPWTNTCRWKSGLWNTATAPAASLSTRMSVSVSCYQHAPASLKAHLKSGRYQHLLWACFLQQSFTFFNRLVWTKSEELRMDSSSVSQELSSLSSSWSRKHLKWRLALTSCHFPADCGVLEQHNAPSLKAKMI